MSVAFMRACGRDGKGRESVERGRYTSTRTQSMGEETQVHGGSTLQLR